MTFHSVTFRDSCPGEANWEPEAPKMETKGSQMGAKTYPLDAAGAPQGVPDTPQDGSDTLQPRLRLAQDAPGTPQDVPDMPQEAADTTHDA